MGHAGDHSRRYRIPGLDNHSWSPWFGLEALGTPQPHGLKQSVWLDSETQRPMKTGVRVDELTNAPLSFKVKQQCFNVEDSHLRCRGKAVLVYN